jgi:hypothetical protein
MALSLKGNLWEWGRSPRGTWASGSSWSLGDRFFRFGSLRWPRNGGAGIPSPPGKLALVITGRDRRPALGPAQLKQPSGQRYAIFVAAGRDRIDFKNVPEVKKPIREIGGASPVGVFVLSDLNLGRRE